MGGRQKRRSEELAGATASKQVRRENEEGPLLWAGREGGREGKGFYIIKYCDVEALGHCYSKFLW